MDIRSNFNELFDISLFYISDSSEYIYTYVK